MLNNKIPALIHFCWFGKKKKPKLVKQCIASWKKYFNDYKIIEWNEDNYNSEHLFYKQAIEKKLWAFASDFARLDILNNYGGIYFDTDMLVTKSFDHLLTNNINIGAEDEDYINAAFLASNKNQLFLSDCLSSYDDLIISSRDSDLMQMTIPVIMTKVLFSKYWSTRHFNEISDESGIRVFPKEYFYPLPYSNRMELNNYMDYLTHNSVAVHLWSATWKKFPSSYYFEHKKYVEGVLTFSNESIINSKKKMKKVVKKLLRIFIVK